MATFSNDWSSYSTGDVDTVTSNVWDSLGTLTSWTRQVTTGGNVSSNRLVVQDDNKDWGSQASQVVNTTVGSVSGDTEILSKCRIGVVSSALGVLPGVGCLLAAADAKCYSLYLNSASSASIVDYTTGGAANGFVGSSFSITGGAITDGAAFWVRLGRSGSTIRMKCWLDGQTEPAGWQASGTETTITGNLRTGFAYQDYASGPFSNDYVGIGTAGSTAPSPSGGATNASNTPTGVAGTGAVGTITVVAAGTAVSTTPTGVSATGSAGDLTGMAVFVGSLTGVAGTGAAGTITVATVGAPVSASRAIIGVGATGSAGSLWVKFNGRPILGGVSGTGSAGTIRAGNITGEPATSVNAYNDGGALTVLTITNITGLRAWVDYVPVYEVEDTQKPWKTDDTGYIPVIEE